MTRAEILNAAKERVCSRENDYGKPENNFERIAKLWNAYTDNFFTAKDVAIMMALLKVARIRGGHKDDNFVDMAGYAACAGELDGGKDAGECYSCRWNHVNAKMEPCCKCTVIENGAGSKWEPADGGGGDGKRVVHAMTGGDTARG